MEEEYYQKLLGAAFLLVSLRPRSESEIRDRLTKRITTWKIENGPMIVDSVIARLKELGYVDDQKFISWWVASRQKNKQKSVRAIIMELKQKGVNRDALESFFETQTDVSLDIDVAREALAKKAGRWAHLPELARKQKYVGILMRLGFSAEVSYRVIDEYLKKD